MLSDSQQTRSHAGAPSPVSAEPSVVADQPSPGRRRLLAVLPFGAFVGLAGVLAWGLSRNAAILPSALIGSEAPEFNLPPVQGRTLGLSNADLEGEVSLVNVFASWCVACREEHPVFMELKRAGAVPIHGINYKDRPADADKWLNDLGDPYERTGADINGRVSIDWGVYGVPETFLIDRQGRIAYKHVGAVTPDVYRTTLAPLIEQLR